jgi:hypothetical protein
MADESKDVEVDLTHENGKAVIEGKTSVPFKTFVGLILQRKITAFFKDNKDEPVIISSDLLTKLASAPDDKQEDRAKLVILALGLGVLMGVFVETAILLLMSSLNTHPSTNQLFLILGVLVGLVILGLIVEKIQNTNVKQVVYDKVEQINNMLG